jgi:hypothetical protein
LLCCRAGHVLRQSSVPCHMRDPHDIRPPRMMANVRLRPHIGDRGASPGRHEVSLPFCKAARLCVQVWDMPRKCPCHPCHVAPRCSLVERSCVITATLRSQMSQTVAVKLDISLPTAGAHPASCLIFCQNAALVGYSARCSPCQLFHFVQPLSCVEVKTSDMMARSQRCAILSCGMH